MVGMINYKVLAHPQASGSASRPKGGDYGVL